MEHCLGTFDMLPVDHRPKKMPPPSPLPIQKLKTKLKTVTVFKPQQQSESRLCLGNTIENFGLNPNFWEA